MEASDAPRSIVFVYGTLKRGHRNHGALAGQRFLAEARTRPQYRMVNLGTYPTLVECGACAIVGELWSVDADSLAELDRIEGIAHGLYRRGPVALAPPHDAIGAEAYFYLADCSALPDHGECW